MTFPLIRLFFVVCGLYDFGIGVTFLFFGPELFDATDIPHPDHWGYIQFGSLMLITFGMMFFSVAYDPAVNKNLILYGMVLKLSYVVLVSYYWIQTGVPFIFKPFVVIDGIMFVLLLMTRRKLYART